VLTPSSVISAASLSGLSTREPGVGEGGIRSLADVEKDCIRRALASLDWNIGQTADALGIHRNTLRAKIKDYGIVQE
jgi:transcriptional regulator of acetoin/glycerol metabolism